MSNFLGIELKNLNKEFSKFKMEIEEFLHLCLNRCRYLCVSIDNKEQKELLKSKEFIDFMDSFGYKLCFENIYDNKKNLPQRSYFCFTVNSKSINAIIKSHFLRELFFNEDIICLDHKNFAKFMIIGYGENEFEANFLHDLSFKLDFERDRC